MSQDPAADAGQPGCAWRLVALLAIGLVFLSCRNGCAPPTTSVSIPPETVEQKVPRQETSFAAPAGTKVTLPAGPATFWLDLTPPAATDPEGLRLAVKLVLSRPGEKTPLWEQSVPEWKPKSVGASGGSPYRLGNPIGTWTVPAAAAGPCSLELRVAPAQGRAPELLAPLLQVSVAWRPGESAWTWVPLARAAFASSQTTTRTRQRFAVADSAVELEPGRYELVLVASGAGPVHARAKTRVEIDHLQKGTDVRQRAYELDLAELEIAGDADDRRVLSPLVGLQVDLRGEYRVAARVEPPAADPEADLAASGVRSLTLELRRQGLGLSGRMWRFLFFLALLVLGLMAAGRWLATSPAGWNALLGLVIAILFVVILFTTADSPWRSPPYTHYSREGRRHTYWYGPRYSPTVWVGDDTWRHRPTSPYGYTHRTRYPSSGPVIIWHGGGSSSRPSSSTSSRPTSTTTWRGGGTTSTSSRGSGTSTTWRGGSSSTSTSTRPTSRPSTSYSSSGRSSYSSSSGSRSSGRSSYSSSSGSRSSSSSSGYRGGGSRGGK